MSLVEIEEHIRPLSQAEKITLIQDIAEMLKEDADIPLLHHLTMAADAADPLYPGPMRLRTNYRRFLRRRRDEISLFARRLALCGDLLDSSRSCHLEICAGRFWEHDQCLAI